MSERAGPSVCALQNSESTTHMVATQPRASMSFTEDAVSLRGAFFPIHRPNDRLVETIGRQVLGDVVGRSRLLQHMLDLVGLMDGESNDRGGRPALFDL